MTRPVKSIFILRHAESPHGGRDFERPLTPRGMQQAKYLGQMVSNRLHSLEHAIWHVSAARRTQMTMESVIRGFEVSRPTISAEDFRVDYDESLYLAEPSVGEAKILSTPEDVQTVVVLAHNPGISGLVGELCREYVGLRPGEGVLISLDGEWTEVSTKSQFQEYFAQDHS